MIAEAPRRSLPARIGAGLSVVILAAAGGWLGSDLRSSGSDRVADTEAAIELSAVVQRKALVVELVGRGTITSPASASVLAPAPPQGANSIVVTGTPVATGGEVRPGTAVVELNGRPVLALSGAIPLFRDVRPGDSGPDVSMVQEAMRAAGQLIPASENGRFGSASQRATEVLYRDAGYEPRYTQRSRDDVDATIEAARSRLAGAQSALSQARSGAGGIPTGDARAAVVAATAELNKVRASEGAVLPAAEAVIVPQLPGVLVRTGASLGDQVEAGTVVAAIGSVNLAVQMKLTEAQIAELGSAPAAARVDQAAGDYESECTADPAAVVAIPKSAGEAQVPAADERAILINCATAPPLESIGSNVRVRITIPRSDGPVLAVPASAIGSDPDGRTFVEVLGSGDPAPVEVRVGREAAGSVEVAPQKEGELDEGMKVRIARR